jgi:RNA polymerase sigma-70 factor (ECF subfamily)
MPEPLDSWFKHEIIVHEAPLTRFLRRLCPVTEDIPDLRQETYARVYEAARKSRPASAKAFLYGTARHVVIDRIRRRRVVTIDTVRNLDALPDLVDDVTPERQAVAGQELRVLAWAFDALPAKCREVVWLRRVDRLTQREVATELGIAEKTVENHLAKGMKRLAELLLGNPPGDGPDTMQHPTENSRGQHQAD